jgi:endo-alpha-1,4-polygalactosaminidase (GH114 family)
MIRPLRSFLAIFVISALGLAMTSAEDMKDRDAEGRHARPMEIQDVDSFDYFIAPGVNGAPRAGQAFQAAAHEEYDMLIADYYGGHNTIDPAGVRIFQDSNFRSIFRSPTVASGRLAIAYIDAGEFMRCCSNIDLPEQASWFDAQGELTAAAPSWFGPPNPKFNGLWLVRDWDPAWQAYILSEIDKIIGLGFDGVFLDTLYNDGAWGPNGYAAGLAGVADYRESQKDFAKAIWHHVRDRYHNPRFVIITNYSGVLEDNVPALTEGLHYSDAFMKESEYFDPDNKVDPSVGNMTIEQYFATRYAKFYAGMFKLHKVVLLQNYEMSFDNEALMLKECARYGFLLSNTNFPQDLIHIDALPICTKEACWATNAAGETVRFRRTNDPDRR